jgi:hypothetical protein
LDCSAVLRVSFCPTDVDAKLIDPAVVTVCVPVVDVVVVVVCLDDPPPVFFADEPALDGPCDPDPVDFVDGPELLGPWVDGP